MGVAENANTETKNRRRYAITHLGGATGRGQRLSLHMRLGLRLGMRIHSGFQELLGRLALGLVKRGATGLPREVGNEPDGEHKNAFPPPFQKEIFPDLVFECNVGFRAQQELDCGRERPGCGQNEWSVRALR